MGNPKHVRTRIKEMYRKSLSFLPQGGFLCKNQSAWQFKKENSPPCDVRSSWRVAELRRKLSGTTKEKARGRLTAEERRTLSKWLKGVHNSMGRKLVSPPAQTAVVAAAHHPSAKEHYRSNGWNGSFEEEISDRDHSPKFTRQIIFRCSPAVPLAWSGASY